MNNLSGLYESQGRYEQAETLYVEALAIAERVLGAEHPTTKTIGANYQKLQGKIIRQILEMPEEEMRKVLPGEVCEQLLEIKKQMGEQE